MSQRSVTEYFASRKRRANDNPKVQQARKMLKLDFSPSTSDFASFKQQPQPSKTDCAELVNGSKMVKGEHPSCKTVALQPGAVDNKLFKAIDDTEVVRKNCSTKELREKLIHSSRLGELKAYIAQFNDNAYHLKQSEERTVMSEHSLSPKLETFKTLEMQIQVGVQKSTSPGKPYLSPRKVESTITACKHLSTCLSPTKSHVTAFKAVSPAKRILLEGMQKPGVGSGLHLPYKYRSFMELCNSIDIVSQMLYNRNETITFTKMRSSIAEIIKRNLTLHHLAQLKHTYPNAYTFKQEKVKNYNSRKESWDLVLIPNGINEATKFSPNLLVERRHTLHDILLAKVKNYHNEFLQSLNPPLDVSMITVARWHPEFDINRIPDLDGEPMPTPPTRNNAITSAEQFLQRTKDITGCCGHMDNALTRLQAKQQTNKQALTTAEISTSQVNAPTSNVLKGIPTALLEKVRQKQAAKALVTMARTMQEEHDIQMYSRLPDLVRLLRNIFVTEKKSILPLEVIVSKLTNCYLGSISASHFIAHLKLISEECNEWLSFVMVCNVQYLKLDKKVDLNCITSKLDNIVCSKISVGE